jgi:hypothetical protein
VASPAAYKPKFNAATILLKRDGVYQTREFFEVASAVKNVLSEMVPSRAKIKIMCSGDLSSSDREKVKRAAIEVLGS